ncbi:MAG: hypothetical protein JJE07_10665 [Flavobacteriaceae bacterium]|nr:hypothetical protein [Flavobacteriaceae bacterium]
MYIWPLKYKNYIAILLAAIIFTKFVVVDSKLLGKIFNSDEIAFVNQSCKFNNYQFSPVQESYSEDSFVLNISYHSFCNSLFNFEIADWTYEIEELSFKGYGSPVIALTTSYNSNISPPPQV